MPDLGRRRILACACVCLSLLTILPIAVIDATASGIAIWGNGNGNGPGRIPGALVHWCETITVDRFVRTPVNGYSALSFSFFGWAVLIIFRCYAREMSHEKVVCNHLRCFPAANWIQVAVLHFGALGSLINHSAVTHYSREPDRASVRTS